MMVFNRIVHCFRKKKRIENTASAITISKMLVTTARVVERPTELYTGTSGFAVARLTHLQKRSAPNTTPFRRARNHIAQVDARCQLVKNQRQRKAQTSG